MSKLTPEQELVYFAELMGWALPPDGTGYPAFWLMTAPNEVRNPCLRRTGHSFVERWNPRRSLADAVELAVKLGVAFEFRPKAEGEKFWAWTDPIEHGADNLCDAICNAVVASREGQDAE